MPEYDEFDSSYTRGRIDGYLHAAARYTSEELSFNQDRWEDLYGSCVVYENVPAYPSKEARRKDEGQVVMCDWEDATETLYLKEGVDLPADRSGTMVFEDGTVVMLRSGDPIMFSIDEPEVQLIEGLREQMMEMLRDTYDYEPA